MTPSYLFSAVLSDAQFDRTQTGETLTITKNNIESITEFTDRPFRQTNNIDYDIFVNLFDT